MRSLLIAMGGIAIGLSLSCQGPAGPDGDDAILNDSLPPQIEWRTPTAGAVIDTSALLSVYADDDQGIWKLTFYIAGWEAEGLLPDTLAKIYYYDWDSSTYPEGPYPLMARAWDAARNQTTTPVVMVWVEH